MRILTTRGRWLLVVVSFLVMVLCAKNYYKVRFTLPPSPKTLAVSPEPSYTVKLMTVRAYCPCELCCGRWADGHVAYNNYKIQAGDRFVAAAADIPFGTMVIVPGYSRNLPVPVLDRGPRDSNKMEVFFNEHQEALNWGVQELRITIER